MESRQLLTAWHNSLNPIDVDASGLVTPLDVLLIVNDLNANGSRVLPSSQPEGITPTYLDVNGDGSVHPLDVLLVVNALNQNPGPLNVALSVAPEADANGNDVVLANSIEFRGQTASQARIQWTVDALDAALNAVPHQSHSMELFSDSSGNFRVEQALFWGLNQVTAVVTDRLGRQITIHKEVVWGDVVSDWNAAILNVVRDWTTTSNDPYAERIVPSSPPIVARNLAIMHVALFDAMNGVTSEYTPYLFDMETAPGASAIAAAASAVYEVAVKLYPNAKEQAVWQASLTESLATVDNGSAKEQGIALGRAVATAVLAERANDGSSASSSYIPGGMPGQWNRTTPDFLPPLLPHWGNVRPMAIEDLASYRPAAPPALSSTEYATAVDEVMRLGRLDSTHRTAEQTEIAQFWADGGGTATPPGHWNRIAVQVSLATEGSSLQRARTMALLNLALADAGIVSWDAKYRYGLWRPIDAIRLGDDDGNPSTVADANWLPLVRTPPFPSYTSGHSTFSGAAASVLTSLFGDSYAFANRSDGHTGLTQKPLSSVITRSFDSFEAAADEAGKSRIYGGIHFRFDDIAGLAAGRAVGDYIATNWLRTAT